MRSSQLPMSLRMRPPKTSWMMPMASKNQRHHRKMNPQRQPLPMHPPTRSQMQRRRFQQKQSNANEVRARSRHLNPLRGFALGRRRFSVRVDRLQVPRPSWASKMVGLLMAITYADGHTVRFRSPDE
jgi:hypothetical protein